MNNVIVYPKAVYEIEETTKGFNVTRTDKKESTRVTVDNAQDGDIVTELTSGNYWRKHLREYGLYPTGLSHKKELFEENCK